MSMKRHSYAADVTVHRLKMSMADSVTMRNNLEKRKQGNKKKQIRRENKK